MLEPNAEIPAAGLLGLPLEPERDAREAERRWREAAESARMAAEIEWGRQAAEQEAAAVPKPRHKVGWKRRLRQRVSQMRDRLSKLIRPLNPLG